MEFIIFKLYYFQLGNECCTPFPRHMIRCISMCLSFIPNDVPVKIPGPDLCRL